MGARRQGRGAASRRGPRRRSAARRTRSRARRRRRRIRLTEAPPPAPPPRSDASRGLVTAALILIGAALLISAIGGCFNFPSFDNPFTTETVDRSSPVVLKSIQDLERFQAATAHFEVIVDLEKDTRFVPAAIRGERVLFVAVGDVDAGVDFSGLDDDAVRVRDDGKSVELELPHAEIFEARIDPARSYVYDRDRGLIDRVASLFEDNPTSERELYTLAEQKLLESARSGSGLLTRAERNTRTMLEGLLRALGFTSVTIRFVNAV